MLRLPPFSHYFQQNLLFTLVVVDFFYSAHSFGVELLRREGFSECIIFHWQWSDVLFGCRLFLVVGNLVGIVNRHLLVWLDLDVVVFQTVRFRDFEGAGVIVLINKGIGLLLGGQSGASRQLRDGRMGSFIRLLLRLGSRQVLTGQFVGDFGGQVVDFLLQRFRDSGLQQFVLLGFRYFRLLHALPHLPELPHFRVLGPALLGHFAEPLRAVSAQTRTGH